MPAIAQQNALDDECYCSPQIFEDIENSTYYVVICAGSGCSRPPAPVLDSAFVDNLQPQTVTWKATKPAGWLADKVKWRAEYTTGGSWIPLWEHFSTEGSQPTTSDPYTVFLGAPGLPESSQVRVRIAWCENSPSKCSCFSDPMCETLDPDDNSQQGRRTHCTDTGDPGEMVGKKGTWGFWVHHVAQRIEEFRAGSEPSP